MRHPGTGGECGAGRPPRHRAFTRTGAARAVSLIALLLLAAGDPLADVDRQRDHGRLAVQDADTLGAGGWQVHLLSEGSRAAGGWSGSGRSCHSSEASWGRAALALVGGAGERLDLSLELPWEWVQDPEADPAGASGAAGALAGAKWRLRDGLSGGPDVALLPAVAHTPSSGGDEGSLYGELGAALVWDLGPRTGLNLDAALGSSLDHGPGGRQGSWRAAAALAWQAGTRLTPSLEIVHQRSRADEEPGSYTTSVAAGLGLAAPGGLTVRAGLLQDLAGRHSYRCTRLLLALEVQL